ncbi:flap endonuclease-1 [Candidatus Woesearchaeota archaeon]|nr:flap endonuclease-1 [Candidatus Woesearchaeota archaeon]
MGVKIFELVPAKETSLDELAGKTLAVDSSLFLYQFLSTIRQRDGTLLMDSKGRVTSHLAGLFNRTVKLMEKQINLVFVFDGKPPELKQKERERRKELKEEAEAKYRIAMEKRDLDEMKKYAARTTRLTPEMIKEAKELVSALGLPVVQAPSEGEAQAAHIVKKGDAFAVASQDADSLMFGAPRLVKNLAITGRRKKAGKLGFETVNPEIIELQKVLNTLGIDNDQLIALGMLIGTDYNTGGVKGIGPKNGLKLVKKHQKEFDAMFKEAEWENNFDFPWTDVFYAIKKMPVTDEYILETKPIDKEKVLKILVEEHDFSPERVNSALDKLLKSAKNKQQKGLAEWV